MITDTDIANSATPFVEAKYALGDPSEGWDCFNWLANRYKALGYEFPREIDGWTIDNYPDLWTRKEKEGRNILKKLFSLLGQCIDPNYRRRADLILFEDGEGGYFAGVYEGNEKVQINFGKKHGILTMELHHVPFQIGEVRRLL